MSTKLCKSNIKCAVFDLDGTLLNTIKTINYYLNFSLGAHGFESLSEDDTMKLVGDGAVKLIERALKMVNADPKAFNSVYKTYNEAYNSSPYYLTDPYEGIAEMILCLRQQGTRLAVLSNKPDFAVKAAVEHFFPNCFDVVLGGRENIPLKPAPDSLINLMESLGATTNNALYVGDSEVDVLTARNAEIRHFVAVSWGFRSRDQLVTAGAKNIIDTPSEILNFI